MQNAIRILVVDDHGLLTASRTKRLIRNFGSRRARSRAQSTFPTTIQNKDSGSLMLRGGKCNESGVRHLCRGPSGKGGKPQIPMHTVAILPLLLRRNGDPFRPTSYPAKHKIIALFIILLRKCTIVLGLFEKPGVRRSSQLVRAVLQEWGRGGFSRSQCRSSLKYAG
jgi:hypothetical protein